MYFLWRGVIFKGYPACCLLFLYAHISFVESYLHCYPVLLIDCILSQKESLKLYVLYLKNQVYIFTSVYIRLSLICPCAGLSILPSPLCMTGCFVSLSSCRVQRTAGTSYKAWCRTSPLNPPRPPLYRDRLAPGKVRLPHRICPVEKKIDYPLLSHTHDCSLDIDPQM